MAVGVVMLRAVVGRGLVASSDAVVVEYDVLSGVWFKERVEYLGL